MDSSAFNFDQIPQPRRAAFAELARSLATLAGENLLSFGACGGWVIDDRCFERTPAQSVLVLGRIDLPLLDRFAVQGRRFGRQGLAPPLIMTPAYIQASCDTFPLELLEIQQLHRIVAGPDHFQDLRFAPADLRLQCERELKSELIQMRQGLVAAAGRRGLLHDICVQAAHRGVRVLRGVLQLTARAVPQRATAVLVVAADAAALKLEALTRAAVGSQAAGFDDFTGCYAELESLATYVDGLGKTP